MNITHLILGTSMLVAPICMMMQTAHAQASTAQYGGLSGNLAKLLNEGDMSGLKSALATALKSDAKPMDLIKDPDYCHKLAVHELLRITGTKNVETVFNKSAKDAAFVKAFLTDSSWVELYLGAGLVPENTSAGLQVLSDIWKVDGSSPNFRNYKSLATGIASTFTTGPFAEKIARKPKECNAVRRYRIFKKFHETGRLQKDFLKLRPWEIRFVVGLHWDDKSYLWANKNINVAPRRLTDACWAAPYTGQNFFGDTIQGPLFYVPWRDSNCEAENTRDVGGVCGGLSHFGVIVAQSHGFPAYPVGQPGHCAYAVRLKRGEWKGGFGGPDGGMHNHIFGGQAPTSFLLMETVFKSDMRADMAYRLASLAHLNEEAGLKDAAIEAWQEALKQTPQHPFFRKELQRLLVEQNKYTPAQWYEYAANALAYYGGNGFAAFDALKDVQDKFINSLSSAEKNEWFRSFHQAIASTPTSWAVKFAPVLDEQIKLLSNDKEKEKFLETVLSTHLQTGDGTNFGQALEWAVNNFVEKGKAEVFSNSFANVAKKSGGGSADPNKLKQAYGKAIFATEKARSIPAFHALSKAAAKYSNTDINANNVRAEIPGGWKLVPADGMVRCSTTSQWDCAWEHLNIIRPCGGSHHTDREKNPHLIVELPKKVRVAGIYVAKTDGNEFRMKKMEVSVSTDGATWFPIATTNDMPKHWLITAPEGKEAKWVKVEAKNDNPEFMHLRHVLVYEK